MSSQFSTFVIEALVQTISGGGGFSTEPPIGIYRSGPEIDGFLLSCGIDPNQGTGSRLPALRGCLLWAASQENGDELIQRVIEAVADPRNYLREPRKTEAVRDYLNKSLVPDGFKIVLIGGRARLKANGTSAAVLASMVEKSSILSFDTVHRNLERAIENAERDPEDAVTAACSVVEAVCRSILVELKLPLPEKKDISGLIRAVQEPLSLSPSRTDLPPEIAEDVRQVLGGLTTVLKGIGALRTHGGDAHGRERGFRSLDARIARLAIHASSAAALFLIETWERKFGRYLPNKVLD